MNKRQYEQYTTRKELQNAGWGVTKASRYNSGSETLAHSTTKQICAHYLTHICGYRVQFEVSMGNGDVDVLAYSEDDIVIVEVETNYTSEDYTRKRKQYVDEQPPREMWMLDPIEAPENRHECFDWIADKIGLDYG